MAKPNKITPEWILEEYFIPLSRLKSSFGVKGVSIDDVRSDSQNDGSSGSKNVEGIRISLRRWKKDIDEEDKIIPDGVDSARG